MPPPINLLVFNAALQILVSSLLGLFMLALLQPWGKRLAARAPAWKDLLATHLDWIMLAFMQLGAAFAIAQLHVPHAELIAPLLVFGGWMNAVPYLVRGFGINAFVLGGNWKQLTFGLLGALSVLAILCAWGLIIAGIWPQLHGSAGAAG